MNEKGKALISVIIPVYNVENYLRRCLDSVVNQTYKNLEIILVDDGSTDSSGAICDEYALKDDRIKVIHKENGGLSSARNTGLDLMTGEYIAFVDSDDFIHIDMMKDMHYSLVINEADVCVCSFKEFEQEDAPDAYAPQELKMRTIGRDEALLMYDSGFGALMSSSCNKMYKKSVFKNIRFPLNRKCEDLATIYKVLFASERIVLLDNFYYLYIIRKNSIMHSAVRPTADVVKGFEEFIQYCKDNIDNQNFREKMVALLLKRKADTILEDYYYSVKRKTDKKHLNSIKEMYKEVRPQLKKMGVLRPQYRVFELNPFLFCCCVDIYYRFIGRNRN